LTLSQTWLPGASASSLTAAAVTSASADGCPSRSSRTRSASMVSPVTTAGQTLRALVACGTSLLTTTAEGRTATSTSPCRPGPGTTKQPPAPSLTSGPSAWPA